jgi:hypothetical protein
MQENTTTLSVRQYESHGKSKSPEYQCWIDMLRRCDNPKRKNYKSYGARGIEVCERWKASFSAFYSDMGLRPSKDHSLDRINNSKGYLCGNTDCPTCLNEKPNCRWATPLEQAKNRRTNSTITYKGETLIIAEWARITSIPRQNIRLRIKAGWSVEDALTIPLGKQGGRREKGKRVTVGQAETTANQ